ncbi:MAG: hypothetical protein JW836_05355 [Deltaproteobacteria bacterium]|nr:hypothetical protein [Deltaproteobacteria bacterium]
MKKRINDNVVSLKAWREARVIEDNLESGLFYQSLIGGIPDRETEEEMSYFAVVYTVPYEDFEDEELVYDPDEVELLTVVREKDVAEFKSLDGRGVERYEIYDVNTDDVHIMYRIPYKSSRTRPVKDKPGV